MKLSQFNILLPYKEYFVLYNTYSKNSIIINEFLHRLILSAEVNNDIDDLESIHPDFYHTLKIKNFIIDSGINELERIKTLMRSIDDKNDSFYLIINSTMNCNFKCWYCYESHIKDSKMNDTSIEKVKNFIKNKCEKDNLKKFTLSFFGGEPLLYFNQVILPIIKYSRGIMKEYGIDLNIFITSNGFLINDDMIKEFEKYKVSTFQITLDGDEKNHDKVRFVSKKRGSYKKIILNIKKLVKSGLNVTLRINYTTANIESLVNIFPELEDLSIEERNRIYLSLNKVWQDKNESLFKLAENFKQQALSFGLKTPNDFAIDNVRNSCYANKTNQATINYNGDVFKCNARDFKSENRLGVLEENGNIVWNNRARQRIESRFSNNPCLNCSILPICGGGCSELAFENVNKEYCVHNFDEESKKQVALKLFLAGLNNN